MLNPANKIDGIKELYADLCADKKLGEADWDNIAQTLFYVPPQISDSGAYVLSQAESTILEHGDAIKAQGQSDGEEFSPVDVLKVQILEGINRTEGSMFEINQLAGKIDLSQSDTMRFLNLSRKNILQHGIVPMNIRAKEEHAKHSIVDPVDVPEERNIGRRVGYGAPHPVLE